ncbi:MAG: SDR family oxidoreductase, partial [Acidimicrobiia bacterium]|nr:SDR family oxidoreductase [Acidimicrobiia bacterium]
MGSNTFDLTDHVAVVTGAGRGIGEGIAKTLAAAGAAVVVAARRTAEIERVAGEIDAAGGQASAITTDVTDPRALSALADGAVDTYGSLTTWVNNAGGSPDRMPLTELDRASWDSCMALNLTAIWEASVAAVARLADGGCIINISSMAAYGPVPGSGHYAAAKAATNSLTQTMARELAPRIRVNGIAPGVVPTEIMKTALGLDDEQAQGLGRHIP